MGDSSGVEPVASAQNHSLEPEMGKKFIFREKRRSVQNLESRTEFKLRGAVDENRFASDDNWNI